MYIIPCYTCPIPIHRCRWMGMLHYMHSAQLTASYRVQPASQFLSCHPRAVGTEGKGGGGFWQNPINIKGGGVDYAQHITTLRPIFWPSYGPVSSWLMAAVHKSRNKNVHSGRLISDIHHKGTCFQVYITIMFMICLKADTCALFFSSTFSNLQFFCVCPLPCRPIFKNYYFTNPGAVQIVHQTKTRV